ncbi:hypothetical protein [Streptomyces sp. NBC_00096]|uniref:hypothetical protein n=1 Tax=Streptomyces sp. NBC_00096 TaxID=2975650 RepID=UPI003246EA22
MTEPWVTGLVNGILYNAKFRNAGSELDGELVRRFALGMREEPISPQPLPRQAAGLREAVVSDSALASAFAPYPGQRPYAESEFRTFLTRLADVLDAQDPPGAQGAPRTPDEPAAQPAPDTPRTPRPRGLRALLRRPR